MRKEQETPLVSVIMNCFNSEEFLGEAIDSVLSQSYENWEIIFWDNASTDTSPEIVKGYQDNRIKYFRCETTHPLGKARNYALEKVSGEFITFLDCDDVWMPNKLMEQIGYFNSFPDTDFVYGNFYSLLGSNRKLAYPEDKLLPVGYITGDLLVRYRLNLQTVMLKKILFDALEEWFDPVLELCEEMDLFLRMSLFARMAYIQAPLVCYRVHGNQYTVTKFDKFFDEKLYIIDKIINKNKEIADKYADEIFSYKTTMAIDKSSDLMLHNDKKLAKDVLKGYRFRKAKAFIFWFLSFLPLSLYISINKVIGRTFIEERYLFLQKACLGNNSRNM